MLLSAPLFSLLNSAGPATLGRGAAQWTRVFELGHDSLSFEAVVQHGEGDLKATVFQTNDGHRIDVFDAHWVDSGNAWKFKGAVSDGVPVAEGRAIALFQDYVRALGVDAKIAKPARAAGLAYG